MKTIDHKMLSSVLKVCYKTRSSAYFWGPPGIGKSYTVRSCAQQLAAEMGLVFAEKYYTSYDQLKEGNLEFSDKEFGFVDLRISSMDPSDLRGIPSVRNGRTIWSIPDFFPLNPDSHGIIFIDEHNLGNPSLQAASQQLVLDRRLGSYAEPAGWATFAAGNRREDRGNVFDLSGPLANRFGHWELKVPTGEEWVTNFAVKNDVDSRVCSFIQWKQNNIYKFGKDVKDMAFPTPRSVTMAAKLIPGITEPDLLHTLVAGPVGEWWATEFVAFCKLTDKVDVIDLLKNPEIVKKITALDLKYCMIGCVADYFKMRKAGPDKKKTLSDILSLGQHLEPEFCMLLLKMVQGYDEGYFKDTCKVLDTWPPLAKKYSQYIIP